MPSLTDLAPRTALTGEDVEWLHRLLADWQLLADLSFADLVLWLPVSDRGGFVAAAHVRPSTGPTAHHDDLVGAEAPRGRRPQLDTAYDEQRICRERDPDWPGDVPVREETIPVLREGRVLAVISRDTNLAAARTPSRLELTYLRTADDLAVMVSQGRFPVTDGAPQVALTPRVGDGLIRLDEGGVVAFASPNAVSAYRRLGLTADLVGTQLGTVTAGLARRTDPVDEALATVVGGSMARVAEVEAGGTTVRLRVIPLTPDGERTAALVLCRDVTELRRWERELVGKEATIREIHHRVKNNLQTVAALLRLQARRLPAGESAAREALGEAERRIDSIAVVHETLSQARSDAVDFDEVADRVDGADRRHGQRGGHRPGPAGRDLRAAGAGDRHAAGPRARRAGAERRRARAGSTRRRGAGRGAGQVRDPREGDGGRRLVVRVTDDGAGLPAGFDPVTGSGLGLQIVRTLVEGELGGTLTLSAADPGTVVELDLPVDPPAAPGL